MVCFSHFPFKQDSSPFHSPEPLIIVLRAYMRQISYLSLKIENSLNKIISKASLPSYLSSQNLIIFSSPSIHVTLSSNLFPHSFDDQTFFRFFHQLDSLKFLPVILSFLQPPYFEASISFHISPSSDCSLFIALIVTHI